MEIIF